MTNVNIILGQESGIGAAIYAHLCQRKDPVIQTTRKRADENSYYFDATNPTFPTDLLERINGFTTVTIFLCIGSIGPQRPFEEISRDEYEQTLNVNALYIFNVMTALKELSEIKKVRVVHYGTTAASEPYYGWTPYCISKAAATMALRCIHAELSQAGTPTQIFDINPGAVDTNMQKEIKKHKINRVANRSAYHSADSIARKTIKLLSYKAFNSEYISIRLNN